MLKHAFLNERQVMSFEFSITHLLIDLQSFILPFSNLTYLFMNERRRYFQLKQLICIMNYKLIINFKGSILSFFLMKRIIKINA